MPEDSRRVNIVNHGLKQLQGSVLEIQWCRRLALGTFVLLVEIVAGKQVP